VTRPADAVLSALRRELSDIDKRDLVVIACSGGPDSIALAAAAAELRNSPRFAAVIIDHGLQSDSAQVAQQAADTCAELGLAADVVAVTPYGPGGPEARARRARYEALHEHASHLGASAVLLGHTLEDQAETVLLGLLRGSGPRALAGMPQRNGIYRRPFLQLPRDVLRQAYPQLPVWHDPHNDDPRYRRVQVRRDVLPVLADLLGPSVVGSLARSAELVRAETDAVDHWARDLVAAQVQHEGSVVRVDARALGGHPAAVVGRVMLMATAMAGCPQDRVTAVHVRALVDLVLNWRGQGAVDLPAAVEATRVSGTVELRQRDYAQPVKETRGTQ